MKRMRISGLVKLARTVRQELSEPISAERLARLRSDVGESIKTIEQMLREEGVRLEDLPSPSRKAYHFLRNLDLHSVVAQDISSTSSFPPDSVSFPGLQNHFDRLLNQLARYDGQSQLKHVYDSIRASSESIERQIRANDIRPEQLKRQSRATRGWLAYFSQRENFDDYLAAVLRGKPIFHAASPQTAGQSPSVLIHFRPIQGIYRVRRQQSNVLVQLPTSMICFEQGLFRSLSGLAFRKSRDRQSMLDAMHSEPYRRILSELDLLGGVVAQTRGIHHDLAASFDRVNATYFSGSLSRPHLVWSRTFTVRKFGHYDHARDTVMVSMSLDKNVVPAYAVDFIVYHELLHKKLGVTWKSNRIGAHTREFTEREQSFQQYQEAKTVLKRISCEP